MSVNHTTTKTKPSSNTQVNGANVNWRRVLDAFQVRFLVLNLGSEDAMVRFFRSQPGWSVDFEDGESIIFARTGTDQVRDGRHQIPEGTP
jgi:hypothetical protein